MRGRETIPGRAFLARRARWIVGWGRRRMDQGCIKLPIWQSSDRSGTSRPHFSAQNYWGRDVSTPIRRAWCSPAHGHLPHLWYGASSPIV